MTRLVPLSSKIRLKTSQPKTKSKATTTTKVVDSNERCGTEQGAEPVIVVGKLRLAVPLAVGKVEEA